MGFVDLRDWQIVYQVILTQHLRYLCYLLSPCVFATLPFRCGEVVCIFGASIHCTFSSQVVQNQGHLEGLHTFMPLPHFHQSTGAREDIFVPRFNFLLCFLL